MSRHGHNLVVPGFPMDIGVPLGGADAPGAPGTLVNQSANTDVTPTIRVPLNVAGGALSNIADDVMHLYVSGSSIANKTLDATDVSNGYVDLTATEQFGVSSSFTARSIRGGTHNSPFSASLVVNYDYIGLIGYGQSNWSSIMSTASSPDAALPGCSVWNATSGQWVTPAGAWGGGNGARALMNSIVTGAGKPVRLVSHYASGVDIGLLVKGQSTYTELLARVTASGLAPNYVVYHQGEGDAAGVGTPQATYLTSIGGLHGDIVGDLGLTKADCPFLVSSLGPCDGSVGTNATWSAQNATLVACGLTHMHYSHSNADGATTDGLHFDAATAGRAGARYAHSILVLEGDETNAVPWFATVAARVSGTETDITLVHSMGTDFTPTSAISGFEVSDDGSTWISATGARTGATTIRLTHANISTVDRYVRHLYGHAPDISADAHDNGSLASPLNFTSANLLADGIPILSNGSSDNLAETTADLLVDTNKSSGTLYWVVAALAATAPNAAQIQAGTDGDAVAAVADGSQAVSAAGTQLIAATGLSDTTDYTAYFVHVRNTEASNVEDADFTTATGAAGRAYTYRGLNSYTGSGDVQTFSLDIGAAASDRFVLVGADCANEDAAATSITAAGVTLDFLFGFNTGYGYHAWYGKLVTTGSGSQSVVATWASSTFSRKTAFVWTLTGLDSTTPKMTASAVTTPLAVAVDSSDLLFALSERNSTDCTLSTSEETPDGHRNTGVRHCSADWVVNSTNASMDINVTGTGVVSTSVTAISFV